MAEIPVEKKFGILCEITRAQHFAWHEAVARLCPDVDVAEVTNKMWEVTGHQTAKAYLKRLDKDKPLAPQVAGSIVWSSQCMGEDAALETTEGKDEAFVRHADCPWFHWHKRLGLLAEDRPGCDAGDRRRRPGVRAVEQHVSHGGGRCDDQADRRPEGEDEAA